METETVIIHGDRVALRDFKDVIDSCRTRKWAKQTWTPRPALHYDCASGQTRKVENSWDHEHCEICFWNIDETADRNAGYVDENDNWICVECYSQFIEKRLDI